ncbi:MULTISPECIES: hypothetical protein [unclassified Streptomyces]|uniref:hypothetical protein n=1 Tax=unclassified Streptomyces TaxID=2593676 RepID=UPI0015874461|nr:MULTISPECIES: hypothetical protein [unclassified Streptomyces]NUV65502.1 hypothetical protein [Streptomyces sp. CAI-121]NUV99463.1 hypothetical protein [Streptomyces sp. CAI 127]NUW12239.1 hypothetical protein [Streptomyces sp. CAI-68]
MANDLSSNSAVPAPDNTVELRFGKERRLGVGNVSERVQVEIVRGATALGLVALAVLAFSTHRNPQLADEPALLS